MNKIIVDIDGEKHWIVYTKSLVPCIKCSAYAYCEPQYHDSTQLCKEFEVKDKHIHFEKYDKQGKEADKGADRKQD